MDLGLPPADLARHIAWDIGVAGLGRHLSRALGATFISQRYSRLVIDCNRDPDRADAIPEVSDGSTVPGNSNLTPAERAARVAAIHDPYQQRIAREIAARDARGLPTTLVSLHSFTPVMDGIARPWRFGVLHQDDSPFSRAVLARLRLEPDIAPVGDNEPYRMDEVDHTVPRHIRPGRIDYVELETRQDLLESESGQAAVAQRLARILSLALGDL